MKNSKFTTKALVTTVILSAIISIILQSETFAGDNGEMGKYNTISAGASITYVVKEDGTLWGCGTDHSHEPTDGYVLLMKFPKKITDNVVSVSAGFDHIMFIKRDGTLWAWGRNDQGEVGDGTTTWKSNPVKIMDSIQAISAGESYSMAIRSDKSLWAWGANWYGGLGDGTNIDKTRPIKIMEDVVSVTTGQGYTLAIRSDDTLWAWGTNIYGQLGDGTTEDKNSPIKVMENVSTVAAGDKYTMAVKKDGTLWVWRDNFYGQFGNITITNSLKPIKVMDNVSSVVGTDGYTMAIKKDGSLWTWGDMDGFGYDYDPDPEPVKIMEDISAISGGYTHRLALKTDGTLWGWGTAISGQLGDRVQTLYRGKPYKIMDKILVNSRYFIQANRTASKVIVDGRKKIFEAYNIEGNNYFKLRDIAMAVNNTKKQFSVNWNAENNSISLLSGKSYSAEGGELSLSDDLNKQNSYIITAKVYLNGKEVALNAYRINENNYFKLRDIGQAFDFGVSWDSLNNTIKINTAAGYVNE